MSKIDISSWGEFRVGDLFNAERGKVKNLQTLEIGDVPVIAAARLNQGVAGNYNVPAVFENKITVSCNGVGCGSTFYHPYKFNTNGDAIVLTELNPMSDMAKQFISCILDSLLTRKYSYKEKCSADKAKAEIIKLPIDSQGNPDWQYMEDYMRAIEVRVDDSISKLELAQRAENSKIDISSWGEFKLGKLLDIKTGKIKGDGLFNIINSVAYHGKDIVETDDDIKGLNYVTRSKFNNGVKCKVVKNLDYIINPKGTISFGAENANFFYQREEYITGNKMYYLDTSGLSEYTCAFLKSILEATFTANYSFSDGMIPVRIYNEIIKLPIDSNGDPDWQYMENYMEGLEIMVNNFVNKTE